MDDPNESTAEGWTALMYAAQRGDAGLVRALLAAGADPDRRNAYGATALTLARDAVVLDALLASSVSLETRMHAIRRDLLSASPVFAIQIARSLPDPPRARAERGSRWSPRRASRPLTRGCARSSPSPECGPSSSPSAASR